MEFSDQVDNSNFQEQDQGLAGLKVATARTLLDVSGGYTRLHEDVLATVPTPVGPGSPGCLQSLRPGRRGLARGAFAPDLTLLVALSRCTPLARQVTDAANLFRLNLDQPVPATVADRLTSGDPFTDRELGANWQFTAARTSFTLAYLDIRERYKLNPGADRNVKDASALFARQLSPVLNWDIGAEYQRQEFAIAGSSNTVNAITSLRWQVGRQLGLRFLYAHSALTPHGYAENQLGVTASYALIEGTPGNATSGAGMGAAPAQPGDAARRATAPAMSRGTGPCHARCR